MKGANDEHFYHICRGRLGKCDALPEVVRTV